MHTFSDVNVFRKKQWMNHSTNDDGVICVSIRKNSIFASQWSCIDKVMSPLVEQKLLTLPEHLSSPPVFSGVRVTRSLVSNSSYKCITLSLGDVWMKGWICSVYLLFHFYLFIYIYIKTKHFFMEIIIYTFKQSV